MVEPETGEDRRRNRVIARNEEAQKTTSAVRVSGTAVVVAILVVACGVMVVWLSTR